MTELEKRLISAFNTGTLIIRNSNIDYIEFGVFGSFSRNDYTCKSDVDFLIVVNEMPNKSDIASLKCDLDNVGCDLAILCKSTFDHPNSIFSESVKRDYRRIYEK